VKRKTTKLKITNVKDPKLNSHE